MRIRVGLFLGLLFLGGCVVSKPKDSNAGLADVKQACADFTAALGELNQQAIEPSTAGTKVEQAALQATQAAATNSKWGKLAADMRIAGQQIAALDPQRVQNERTYVYNGPAAQVIDTVNQECAGHTAG